MTGARDVPLVVAVVAVVAVAAWLVSDASRPSEPVALVEPPAAREVVGGVSTGETPTARGPSTTPARAPIVEGRAVELPRLDEPVDGFDVELLVVDARGEPVADATVEVWADRIDEAIDQRLAVGAPLAEALAPERTLRTDTAGRVTLAAVPAIAPLVARTDDGRVSRARRALELAEAERAVLVVATAPRLVVEVVDGDGRGVPDAVVRLDASRASFASGEPWAHGARVTDAAGRAELLVPRDVFGVAALVGGRASTEVAWLDVDGSRDVRLHAPGGRVVAGRIVGRRAGGETVALGGAVVRLARAPGAPVPPGLLDVDVTAAATTDDLGRFTLAVPLAGRYRLVASAPGWSARRDHELALFGDESRRDVELRLEPPTRLAGQVVDERGAPVGGGRVVARWSGGPDVVPGFEVPNRSGDVGADGRFVVDGVERSGSYSLWYVPPGAAFGATPTGRGALVDVAPGRADLVLVVRDDDGAFVHPFNRRVLERPDAPPVGDAALRLEVLGADGRALGRVLLARERRTDAGWRAEGGRRLSRADERGHHAVGELVDGAEYRFTLHASGHGVVRTDGLFAARDAPIARVALPASATLRVRVVSRDGPVPFAEVDLSLPELDRAWPTRRADERGAVVFDDLLPGSYEVGARLGGRSGRATVDAAEGDAADVTVSLRDV